MENTKLNKNIYIRSLEGETIYNHVIRNGYIKNEYKGMLGFSLGLLKLKSENINITTIKNLDKEICNDVINVKFSKGVMSALDLIADKTKKLDALINLSTIGKLNTIKLMQFEYDRLCAIDNITKEVDNSCPKNSLPNNSISSHRDNLDGKAKKKVKSLLTESEKFLKNKLEKTLKYANKLKNDMELINKELKEDKGTKWDKVSNDDLRTYLYENGFTITTNKNNTKYIEHDDIITYDINGLVETIIKYDKYVVYKRSVSKSRVGNVLYCKESLHDTMVQYGRLGLDFNDYWEGDFTSLLATESLIESSLEDTIKIDVKNILIISDVDSKFFWDVNVVKTDKKTGRLDSFPINKSDENKDYMVSNSLFDGSSLLESSYFEDGVSMKLLRQHAFKSASFSTNINLFLKEKCPKQQNFDTWKIPTMFDKKGNRDFVLAKNVKMIITPNSLKALKFSKKDNLSEKELEDYKGLEITTKEMWEYWKTLVKSEGSIFGICKSEHESCRGNDENGDILQQSSYQMLGSINFNRESMLELTKYEREYIEKLKNDDEFFLQYLEDNANDMNANEVMVALVKNNKDFRGVRTFRDLKSKKIKDCKEHIKKGKVRLNGDYAVLLGNGIEYLYHSIGKLDVNNPQSMALENNEIYTNLFGEDDKAFNKEYTCFRNPHTAQFNILVGLNTRNSDISKYFNISKNMVMVNAINYPLQDILSGCDRRNIVSATIKTKNSVNL